jgi:hypothetical protein
MAYLDGGETWSSLCEFGDINTKVLLEAIPKEEEEHID